MQTSRDSSLWRSLAVAFGDGLAFGVGMKLTQTAARQVAPPRTESNVVTDRMDQVEQRVKRLEQTPAAAAPLDQKVLETIVAALEARLHEQAGQVDRRLADLEARITIELKSLDQKDHSIAGRIEEEIRTMQAEMINLHRQFGEAVARVVTDQVAAQVEARAGALESSLVARLAATVDAAVGKAVSVALSSELERKDHEIAELRQRQANTDTNVMELVLGIGRGLPAGRGTDRSRASHACGGIPTGLCRPAHSGSGRRALRNARPSGGRRRSTRRPAPPGIRPGSARTAVARTPGLVAGSGGHRQRRVADALPVKDRPAAARAILVSASS